MKDAIALLYGFALEEGVDLVSALVVGRLDVLWLYLQPGLTHHSRTLNMPLSDGQVQGVLAFICLHIQLKVHCLLYQRQENGRQNVDVAPFGCQMNGPNATLPDLLRV